MKAADMQQTVRPTASRPLATPQPHTRGACPRTRAPRRAGCVPRATQPTSPPPQTDDEETRFRWNPAQSRWERVKKSSRRGKGEKYTMARWEEGGMSTIQTKSGSAYTVWPVIHAYLTDVKLPSVTPEEALRLQQEEGALLVDPRVPWDFEQQRIAGAVSAPLFRGVAGKSSWDTLKRAVMAVGFAMRATERNPDFLAECERALPDKGRKVIVYCGLGGTIKVGAQPYKPGGKSFKDDPERMFGRESRSLKACYELLQAGYTDVVHLQGGLSQWRYEGLPIE